MALYDRLSSEGKTLADEAYAFLKKGYDPETHLVTVDYEGSSHIGIRESMYFALSLLIYDREWETVEAICRAVLALQMDAPGEVFHGAFRHSSKEPFPPANQIDADRLGLYGRYYADIAWEKVTGRFAQLLSGDPALQGNALAIETLLRQALSQSVPVAWLTYEPNTREFILMCLAMLLEHGSDRLSSALIQEIDRCARRGMEGAIARSRSNFTPLNTNIQCMHVFLLDYFGKRFGEAAWRDYAKAYGAEVLERYREHHACAEFNSPTYYGVDLSTLGFIRRYSGSAALIAMANELEDGIWHDAAEFYNPAMRCFCGPYSRAYELDISIHTCFYDLFHLCLGEKDFPWHPFSIESVCNPLLLLGDPRIPVDVKKTLLTPKQDAALYHRFRELSERGDPENNSALCTATGWITPDLMTGALAGSENPSYQLHPLVIVWRHGDRLGTVKLLRCLPDGRMNHMHTVFFDGRADRNRLTMDVNAQVSRDVDIFFEVECEGLDAAAITPDAWRLPGLDIALSASAPAPRVKRISSTVLRIVYPARLSDPDSLRMHFDLTVHRTDNQ